MATVIVGSALAWALYRLARSLVRDLASGCCASGCSGCAGCCHGGCKGCAAHAKAKR